MKKIVTFLFSLLMLFSLTIWGQTTNQSGTYDENKFRDEADNNGYWKEAVRRGIDVPLNQVNVPVRPAEPVKTPRGGNGPADQMGSDVCVWDETGVTQSENSIFSMPSNDQYVLNSNNSESGGSIYGANYLHSYNGGSSWSGSHSGAGGGNWGDPAACIGPTGRRYIGFITSSAGQGIAYSDNGTSWTPVTIATVPSTAYLLDKNHLMVDTRTSGTYSGYVYSAWSRFQSGHVNDNDLEFSRSINNGVSWSTPINISNAVAAGNHNQGVNVQTGPTGQVYCAWVIYDNWSVTDGFGETAIGFARSLNGGSSFYAPIRAHNNILGIRPRPSTATTNPTGKNMRVNSFPSMSVDKSGGPYNGYIYITWANVGVPGTNLGSNVSVYCMRSTNGGVSWQTPVRVNQGTTADNYASFFPWITCDPATGKLFCIFYDDRMLGSTSSALETWCAYSEDGGVTWDDFRVGDVSFTPTPIPGLAYGYFGDYLGIDARNNNVYPSWTDNRSGRALTYVSPIKFSDYCIAIGGGYEYISNVTLGSINNSSTSQGYENYTNLSTNLEKGSSNSLSVTIGSGFTGDDLTAWIDYNRDGDFNDANEMIGIITGTGTQTINFTVPTNIYSGACTMRVRLSYSGSPPSSPCGSTTYGEVEDYTVNIYEYCVAGGGCYEHISNVQIGTINNASGCDGYKDYSNLSTDINSTSSATVTVTNGVLTYPSDQCGIWVDWNNDNDFADANETVSVSGTPGIGPYTALIDPPPGVISGAKTMRIRITYTGAVDPCGVTSYGEVEDYTINVTGIPGLWKGTVSTAWTNPLNWDDGVVPNTSVNVVIPSGTPYQPVINNGEFAYCQNLTINSGATLTQNGTSYLYIYGNLDSDFGTFTQNGVSYLYFDGTTNNTWDDDNMDDTYQHVRINKDLPTYSTFMWQDMTVEQSFEVREGEFKIDAMWTLTVNGAITNAFEVEDGGKLTLTDEHINVVNGDIQFYDGSQASIVGGSVSCGRNFNIYDNITYDIQFAGGVLTMHGSVNQNLNIIDAGSYLNDFEVNKSAGSCIITGMDLNVKNDITINSGIFNSNTFNIHIGGNWSNNVGIAGYVESTGRVVFDGPGPNMQFIYGDETFNILENNTVQAIRVGSSVVTCNSYDWTSGSVSVSLGTFIANDLFDNGIYGSWYALTGSEIYLYQDAGQFVDFLGSNILIYGGGLIKVIGGADESYWCTGGPLSLEINTGGILDFDGPGITIFNSYPLTETITDGSIKTSGWFTCNRTDFNPAAGTFEFYGGSDSRISVLAGSTFYDVLINKSGGDKSVVQLEDRDGSAINSSKTNSAILHSSVNIANDLTISDGTLVISTFTATINGDCYINGHMDVGTAGNVLNHGLFEQGATGMLSISGGSFVNDHPYGTKAWQYLHGTLNLSAGLFEIMHNSILFESTFNDFITGGTIRTGMSFRALTPGTFEPSGGNVEFTGTGTYGPYIDCPAGNYFNDFDINSSENYVLYANTEVRGNVVVDNGSLDFYGFDLSCLGNFNVNNGGSVMVNNGSILKLDGGSYLSVAAGGEIQLVGTAGNEAMVTHISTGSYSFSIFGTIGAQHAIFEFMDGNGINVKTTGIIDPVYTFNNCRFQSGSPSPSALLVLNNAQVFTCNDAYFENTFGNTQYNVWKYYDTGEATFINATGDYEGENFDYDPYNRVDWTYTTRSLDLTVFLEGPFIGSTNKMALGLNSILPLSQPFDTPPLSNPYPDWYYTGAESVAAIPNPFIVDWILVQLRDAPNVATAFPSTAIYTQAAFLTNTGEVVDLDGVSPLTFTGTITNNLYAVVWTRNHLGIISANPLVEVGGLFSYNFSTSSSQAYGGVNSQKQLSASPIIWGMMSGDANATGLVAIGDKTNVWSLQAGEKGYLESDYNYNGQIENVDKNAYWLPNMGKGSQIPE